MKSPITGKMMNLTLERRSLEFRKEKFEVIFHYFNCEDSGEKFTTTDLDEVNFNQLYNQYRDRLNIPFPEEIKCIREKYKLSASKFSQILGFGANSYRNYEMGEMPSVANANLILMVSEPHNFIEMVNLCGSLDETTKRKHIQIAKTLIEEKNVFDINVSEYMLGSQLADINSGYRKPNLKKFTEMVVYFSEKLTPFKTKLNKLLFYADFSMFKNSCFSISGIRYRAIEMGPVPYNFQSIFEFLNNKGEVEISNKLFPSGVEGEQFQIPKGRKFDSSLFSEKELITLEKVAKVFKNSSTSDIIDISHNEQAWISNVSEKKIISYEYAFSLQNI